MNTANVDTNLIEGYFTILMNPSANNKLELIARLSNSMKTSTETKDNSWQSLFEAFDQSADEFVEELKKGRKFIRKSVEL